MRVILLLLVLVACVSAQSLCDKYATALKVNGSTLIGQVVGGTVNSVVVNTTTKRYFDGSLKPFQDVYAINYTDPSQSAALNHLVGNLDTFFYAALNCTDGSLGPYKGQNMTEAHKYLPIGPVQFESFNRQVLQVLAAAGVSADDQAAILGVLNSLKGEICNQPSCKTQPPTASICDRYSAILNTTGYDLMDAVVAGVLANVTSPVSPLKRYFDGSIPGTRNYITNETAAAFLRAHLDQFFGLPTVLACSGTFPPYQGIGLVPSHANLGIGLADFNLFNQVVLDVMKSAGVTQPDLNTVNAVLVSTKSQICTLCNAANTTSTSGSSTSTTARGTSSTSNAGLITYSSLVMFVSAFALYVLV